MTTTALGLSASLVGRLEAWQQWSESMVNIADPNDSRLISDAEHEALAAEGRRLAARVAHELPHARVWYYRDLEPAADTSAAIATMSLAAIGGYPPRGSRLRTALASMVRKASRFG